MIFRQIVGLQALKKSDRWGYVLVMILIYLHIFLIFHQGFIQTNVVPLIDDPTKKIQFPQ